MKKYFSFLFIIIALLILNGFLLLKNKNSKIQEPNINFKDFYENKFVIEKQNENLKLNKNLKLLTLAGDTLLAKNVFIENRIVLRYSVLNCGECIDAEYNILSKYNSLITDQVCIIAHYDRVRDLIGHFKKLSQIGLKNIPIYLILNDELGIPMDEHNIPYYFNINSNLILSNFFIPTKELPKLSENYLNLSLKNFFSDINHKKTNSNHFTKINSLNMVI